MTVRKYKTTSLETTLASSINATATSCTVAAGTGSTLLAGLTLSPGEIFVCAIDPDTSSEEIVYVTGNTGDTLAIQRQQAGTSGTAHNTGATIRHVFTGEDAQHFEDQTNAAVYPTATQTLSNKTLTSPTLNNALLRSPNEVTLVSATASGGTINFDAKSQTDLYYTTPPTGNWTLNVRGDGSTTLNQLLANVNDSITIAFKATIGATNFYQTGFTIDGTAAGVTIRWQGALPPSSGNSGSVDIYTFNIVKTAALPTPTYTVFASQTKFS